MSVSAHRLLTLHILAAKLPPPEHEYRFAPPRHFRFDIAWPSPKVAVECDGATWVGGRHTRGAGHRSDCIKRNLAQELGWIVLTYPPDLIEDGTAIKQVKRVLEAR